MEVLRIHIRGIAPPEVRCTVDELHILKAFAINRGWTEHTDLSSTILLTAVMGGYRNRRDDLLLGHTTMWRGYHAEEVSNKTREMMCSTRRQKQARHGSIHRHPRVIRESRQPSFLRMPAPAQSDQQALQRPGSMNRTANLLGWAQMGSLIGSASAALAAGSAHWAGNCVCALKR